MKGTEWTGLSARHSSEYRFFAKSMPQMSTGRSNILAMCHTVRHGSDAQFPHSTTSAWSSGGGHMYLSNRRSSTRNPEHLEHSSSRELSN
jgi:hypothetical protein